MKTKVLSGVVLAACIGLGYSAATFAHSNTSNLPPKKVPVMQSFNLYSAADKGNVLQSVPVQGHHLIPIFKRGDWLKVGDPKDGQIGWVNLQQYHQAIEAQLHPHEQSFFFSQSTDKNGKTHVVAYKDGKKLSEKEARVLLKHSEQDQAAQWRTFNSDIDILQKQSDRMFNDPFFHQGWGGATYFAPPQIIVVRPGQLVPKQHNK